MRNGDFSASPTPIYDPPTGNARTARAARRFPATSFRANRFDPIVQKLIADLPLPNQPGWWTTTTRRATTPSTRHNIDAKMNYNPTRQAAFTARLGWLGYNFENPAMFGALGGLPVNTHGGQGRQRAWVTPIRSPAARSYVLSTNFLIDTYAGITTIEVLSEPEPPGREPRPRLPRHSGHKRD